MTCLRRRTFLLPVIWLLLGRPAPAQETRFDSELARILAHPAIREALAVIESLEPTTTQDLIDLTEIPAAGSLHWFLVRADNPAGLGPAGAATAGSRIQDSWGDCP